MRAQERIAPARPSILVVEDERVVAMDLAGALRELGYSVAGTVARAHEAIRRASELQPDLILMDIRLAGEPMDGIEVARVIKQNRDVPLIYLTAHSDADTLRRATATGASGYLVKPFKTPELRCMIEIALHKHAADRMVRDRERWLSVTLQSVDEAVVATDPDGRIQLFNRAAEHLTGWSETDVRSRSAAALFSIVDEQTGEPLDDVIGRVLSTRKPHQRQTQAALVSRCGRRIQVEEFASPIVDEREQILGAVWILRDITERQKQFELIRNLNEDLERQVAQRTAELQTVNRELESFSYSVAHDLRAPLRAISAFSELLKAEHTSPLGLQHLERVRGAVRRMGDLIDALLALAGVGRRELHLVPIDLSELARSIGAEIAAGYPERPVEFKVDAGLVAVADATLLRLILGNLIGNAFKFSSGRDTPRVQFGSCNIGGNNAFYVRDNGAGFDPRYAGKLFGAFQRLHHESAFPGTGIGLAIVARAVHRLGGTVWASSQLEQGATFYFTLPESTARDM